MPERHPRAPRGVRNNNPGNIEKGAPWQGLMPRARQSPEQRREERFAVFAAPKWGFRAMARTLITYQDKHGVRTMREALARWAPPSENATDRYVEAVADATGLDPDEPLDFTRYAVLAPLVTAIARHENGGDFWSEAEIAAGLALAGVEPAQRPLSGTRTMRGVGGAGAAAGALAVTEIARQAGETAQAAAPAWSLFRELLAVAPWIALGVLAAMLAWIAYARFDDRRRALR